jgi:hypothetical protein
LLRIARRHGASHDLALDQHRVDDHAAIVGDHIVVDVDPAGFAVDFDVATCTA